MNKAIYTVNVRLMSNMELLREHQSVSELAHWCIIVYPHWRGKQLVCEKELEKRKLLN